MNYMSVIFFSLGSKVVNYFLFVLVFDKIIKKTHNSTCTELIKLLYCTVQFFDVIVAIGRTAEDLNKAI